MILTGSCSSAANATEYRTMVPLPECWLPSIVIIAEVRRGEGGASIALDVQKLLEHVANLDEGFGVFHHLVDVLVRGRNLVKQDV